MNTKQIALVVFVMVCFVLIGATILDALSEVSQASGQDISSYRAGIAVSGSSTLEPMETIVVPKTATPGLTEPAPTEEPSGMFDED